jgi:enamine deaminase RidA (YjgF/YER057c/UK114 family)
MSETIESRLAALGVELPAAAAPAANYLPFVRHNDILHVSGQLPLTAHGVACRGRLGDSVTVEDARQAARLCAINIIAQAKAALDGDLEQIAQVLRITGFVASAPHFIEQHLVVNGASDFLVEALGERGRHARAAVGVASLPLDAAVEIDAVIAVT